LTGGAVVREVDDAVAVVTGGPDGPGAADVVLAHADSNPIPVIASPSNSLVRMW
jgi:hypothetical protein